MPLGREVLVSIKLGAISVHCGYRDSAIHRVRCWMLNTGAKQVLGFLYP